MGRPTLFTQERWDRILEGAAEGEFLIHTLQRLRKGDPARGYEPDPEMPSDRTVRNWIDADQALYSALAHAREIGDEKILADTALIADDNTRDYVPTLFGPRIDSEHVSRSKLRVETRLKILAIRNPRRYGAKVELAGDPDRPVAGKPLDLAALPEPELVRLYQEALDRRNAKGDGDA